jgi:hypothetical protein
VREVDLRALADVRGDADLSPHLGFGGLVARIVLGEVDRADTKEQVCGQVFAFDGIAAAAACAR